VFVHGCYWHRHEGCKAASTPATNVEFWQAKFARNVERDRKTTIALEASGWRVLVAWECEFRSEVKLDGVARELADRIRRTGGQPGIPVDRPSPGYDAPSPPLNA
jgi:DNA mismatch endonuclease (patch repair protein)